LALSFYSFIIDLFLVVYSYFGGVRVGVPAVGKTPFSGNTPFVRKRGANRCKILTLETLAFLHSKTLPVFTFHTIYTNHTLLITPSQAKARSNGVFPTAGVAKAGVTGQINTRRRE
jgi:hypothetical protein